MKTLISRLLRLSGVLLICACAVMGMQFFSVADDQPKAADLTHLTFTATGQLPATIVMPRDGESIGTIATQVSVTTVKGAGIELSINGAVVSSRNIGRMTVAKDGTTQFDFFGVVLHPGPNTIVATAIGASGVRGASQTETIFGPGQADTVRLSMMGSLVADGRSTARLIVSAYDRWNHPAMPGSEVHVSVIEGTARIGQVEGAMQLASAPMAGSSPGPISASAPPAEHYGLGAGGRIAIPITASLQPGTLTVRVNIGEISDTQSFVIAPYLRAPIVNGLVSVGAGSLPVAVDGDGRYDGGGARQGRIALFGSGKVGRGSSLTVSYESQNRLTDSSSYGPYVQDPNERPYQTYGDSSSITSDFHSNDRLYARIDNGRNNAMWGEFTTSVGDPEGVAHYQQLQSGFKAEAGVGGTGQGRIMGFTARNQTAFVSFATPVSGLGALMQPLHPDIVVGSDILSLVSLDRKTGAVISQTQLARNLDYTIDYATGIVRFLIVPLPFDMHFNPQVLYVQYQYQGPGVASETTGGDFKYALTQNRNLTFDFGYMNDSTGSSNYALATESLAGRSPTGDWRLSHGSSSGVVPNNGSAIVQGGTGSATAFQLDEHVNGNQVAFNYQNVGPGFANPFGGFTVNGLEQMTASFAHQSRNRSSFTLTAGQERNTGEGDSNLQQTFTAMWQAAVSKALSFSLGLQAAHQVQGPGAVQAGQAPVQTVTGSTAQMQAGLQWRPASRLDVQLQHQASLGGNSQVEPSQTTAELDYDFPKQGKVFLRELLGGAVSSFAGSTSQYTAPTIGSRSTQIGVERTVGPNTAIDTSYMVADNGDATNIYTTLGIQESFKFGKRLAGNASFQSAESTGTSPDGFTVFGTGFTYTDTKDFRASIGYQTRGGFGGGSTFNGGATGHIGENIALLGTFNETFGNGLGAIDDRVSLAYRPAENDRFISLLGLDRQSGGFSGSDGTADVLSFEEVFRPTENSEIVGRFGYKLNGDGYYLAHSSVAGLRFTQDLGRRFDFSAEAREMSAGNIAAAHTTDFATELGYKAPGGMRLAGGYNFSGSVDPTLTGHPVRKGFYITVTTLLDRIFGWGKQ